MGREDVVTMSFTNEEVDIQLDEILDAQGNAVTGGFTKDTTIRWVGLIVFIILFSSWTTQWVAFTLPLWKEDKYHKAGLFIVCSHAEWKFENVTRIMCSPGLIDPKSGNPTMTYPCGDISLPGAYYQTTQELVPGTPVEKCQSVESYVDDFKKIVCIPPYEQDQYCFYADTAKAQIVRSRWFEAVSTVLDMIFGITTLVFMMWPDEEPRKNIRNGMLALIGIFLTPWPTVIDLMLQNEYWNDLGIGIFETNNKKFMAVGAQIGIATSTIDLILQFGFLSWAVRRYGWRIRDFKWEDVKMGPQLYFGGSRIKLKEEQNAKKIKLVVDAVMNMGVPPNVTREQVELITIAHNADINAVIEVVMVA
ncbi:hypothetical protein BC830DRAFT_212001 [Chytriomyces sp. MP71]|nr:hypothetical protein BC830DRAFT_212001 [Chytriomyces sp. MP71]